MNKKKLITLVVSILLVSGGYWYLDKSIINDIKIEANYKVFNSLDEMVNDADIIMMATVTNDFENILNEYDGFVDGYTLTKVNVKEIIKGDDSLENTQFEIAEPTYLVENKIKPGQTRFSYEDYTKLEPDSNYILLLKESDGKYWVNALHQGKYNIDNHDVKENELSNKNKDFKNLKDNVMSELYSK